MVWGCFSYPVATSHIFIVLSLEAEMMWSPLGMIATDETLWSCPARNNFIYWLWSRIHLKKQLKTVVQSFPGLNLTKSHLNLLYFNQQNQKSDIFILHAVSIHEHTDDGLNVTIPIKWQTRQSIFQSLLCFPENKETPNYQNTEPNVSC